ncbi:MAG: alanine--tRNA ligase [Proteobacteria bacterium]|nr:alanine--tRNA ligase [Pseudomonadota bacterium]
MTNPQVNPSYKVIADHLRCTAFLIADGVLPANEGRGYVLRRIMRRAILHAQKLSSKKQPVIYKLVDDLIEEMGEAYPELVRARDLIIDGLKNEEERFITTIDRGLEILEEELKHLKKGQKFAGEVAFKLYDTYGFPLDLTQTILKEKNIEVDLDGFDKEMDLQKKRAKENWAGSGGAKDANLYFDLKEKLGKSEFVGYGCTKAKAKILAILQDGKEIDKAVKGCEIILDKTPFYATSGGQRGDDGNIINAKEDQTQLNYEQLTNLIDIGEVRKAADLFIHPVTDIKGEFKVGDEVVCLVNNRNRQFRAQNHSATHLLHFALKKVLGNQVTQKGSDVRSTHLTFDFNHNKPVTDKELNLVEDLVNFYIRQDSTVNAEEMPIDQAQQKGAVALFGEKYGDVVRVLSMAKDPENKDLSIEFCGGTHVGRTGNIGLFKIISEKGIAAGIRRIEAKSGYFALQHLRLQERKLNSLLEALKIKQQFDDIHPDDKSFIHAKAGFNDLHYFSNEVKNEEILDAGEAKSIDEAIERVSKLGADKLAEIKKRDKEIEKLKKEKLSGGNSDLKEEKIGDITLIHSLFEDIDAKEIRNLITQTKDRKDYKENAIIAFFGSSEDKVSLALTISDNLADKFNASKLIPNLVEKIGGKGGGGKPNFAMGGGNDKNGVPAAVEALKEIIQNS